ncbi:MAG: hypothetical protein ACK5LT_13715 [Lachnospirales bacterium]
MNIKISYKGTIKNIDFGNINLILGRNGSGKTSIIEHLIEGLNGEAEFCTVDGLKPTKNDFNIIYIDAKRDLDSEVALKAKSNFQKNIFKNLLINHGDELEEITKKFIVEVNNLLEDDLGYNYNLSQGKIKISSRNVKKLDTVLFELEINSNSQSAYEEFYIRQHMSSLNKDKYTFIFIDDIDRYLDYDVIQSIFKTIPRKNCCIICTTNKKSILYDVEFSFICNTRLEIIDLMEKSKLVLFKEYLQSENIKMTLDDYIMQNEHLYYDNDYFDFFQKNKEKVIISLNY